MKKIHYFPVLSLLAGVLAATLFFSCAKNEVADPGDSIQNPVADTEPDGQGSEAETTDDPTLIPQEGEMTEDGRPVVMLFGVKIDDGEEEAENTPETSPESTKTHLESKDESSYYNFWTVGDQVKINNTPSAALPEANISNGGKRARFPMAEVVPKYGDSWYVGYPASAFSFSSGTGTVTVPSTQAWVDGTYDPAAYILLGKSASQSLSFFPQMAVVRFTPQDAEPSYGSNIKNVRIEAIGNDAMSGKFTTDYNNGTATFVPVDGQSYPYVQIDAPNQSTGLAFGTQFFFLIPAKTYSEGIRFVITTVDGKSMSVAKAGAYTAYVSKTSTIKPPKYVPSEITLNATTINSSTIGLSWHGANASTNKAKSWKIHVYSDSACNTEVRTVSVPANAACWTSGMTTDVNFAIGGLAQNTTHYFKVEDVSNAVVSDRASAKTAAFSVVPMTDITPSSSGVVFAEDFSELCGFGVKYNGLEYGGCYNSIASKRLDATDWSSLGYVAPESGEWTLYNDGLDAAVVGKRLAGWMSEGNAIAKCGYLKLGGSSKKGWALTPAFRVAEGYMAVVNVTVNTAKYDASTIDHSIAVVHEAGSGAATRESNFTWVSVPDPAQYDGSINSSGTVWQDAVATSLYLRDGDRLEYGSLKGSGTSNQRILLNSIKVEVTAVVPEADYLISNYERLQAFMDAASTDASVTGLVTHEITLTSAQNESLAPLYPLVDYTGTLDGNNKTITGLTQPFFADLQGTVKNLTLNSTLDYETDTGSSDGLGIFAQYLNGTMTDCISKGSVTFQPASAITNATRYVGGMVGRVVNSGSITKSTNYASVSIPHNSQSNDMILNVGGVAGSLDNNSNCSNVHNKHDDSVGVNSGKISVSIIHSSSQERQCCVGGVFGYVTSKDKKISNCTNSGAIEYAGTSYGTLKVGGLVGWMCRKAETCHNTGAVTITGAASVTKGTLHLGGLMGLYESYGPISGCYNAGTISNAGANTDSDIEVGGLCGRCHDQSISSCYNDGRVENSGDSAKGIFVGGICGLSYAETSSCTYLTCHNSGIIINSGYATDSKFACDVALGGLVGFLKGNNILTSTSSAYNYNEGAVTESSTTGYIGVGGIAGFNNGSSTDMAYVKNIGQSKTEVGMITISGNTRAKVYVGGVLGLSETVLGMDYASNSGDIVFSGVTISHHVKLGGVFGGFNDNNASTRTASCTLTGLYNSGRIYSSDGNMKATSAATYYTYIGGVSGNGNCTNKSYINCGNEGEMYVYNNLKTRLGGVVAYVNVNPTGSWCHENIRYYKKQMNDVTISGNGEIGGVVGYLNVAEVHDLSYEGTLNSRNSDYNCYTGGIVGRIGNTGAGAGNVSTFRNCRVAGKVSGAGSGYNTKGPGLFTTRSNDSGETTWNFTFIDCVVRTGTKATTDSDVTITSSNVNGWVVGRYAPTNIATSPSVGSWSW